MTLSIKSLFATLNINDSINDNINDTQNDTLHKRHSVQMTLNITTLYHHADCRYAEYCILFIVMLNTAIWHVLSATMLNVIMLSIHKLLTNILGLLFIILKYL